MTTFLIRDDQQYYACHNRLLIKDIPSARPRKVDAIQNKDLDFIDLVGHESPTFPLRYGEPRTHGYLEVRQSRGLNQLACRLLTADDPQASVFKKKEQEAEHLWARLMNGTGLKLTGFSCEPGARVPSYAKYVLQGSTRWLVRLREDEVELESRVGDRGVVYWPSFVEKHHARIEDLRQDEAAETAALEHLRRPKQRLIEN